MKKLSTLLMGIAMIASLTACGTNTSDVTTDDIGTNDSSVSTTADAEQETPADTNDGNSDTDTTTPVTTTTEAETTTPTKPEPEPEPIVCVSITEDDVQYYYDEELQGVVLKHYTGDAEHIIYPTEFEEGLVVGGESRGWCEKTVKTVEFPDTFTKIPDYALTGAGRLETVVLLSKLSS